MPKKQSARKGKGTLFPVDNWEEVIIVNDKLNDDIYTFQYPVPQDLTSHLKAISTKCLALIDKNSLDALQFLEAFHSSVVASHLAEMIKNGSYDINEVVALSIKLGELSTIATYRYAEHEYASGVNMKQSSKKATQSVTKERPTKQVLARKLSALRKVHHKETRVIVEAAKHFKVGKSTLYKWKSELGV
jgi:hypothetical protein